LLNIHIDLHTQKEQKPNVLSDPPKGNTSLIAELRTNFSAPPERPASSRAQGKHSYLLPPERPRATELGQQQQHGRYMMERHAVPNETPRELADDLLRGADSIAEFIFGTPGCRRKVYYLAECSRLPVFRLGSVLCARRSVLLNWIAGQENRALPPRS
jgi:hypothetical protein